MQVARATSVRTSESLVRGLAAAVPPSILAWGAILLLARQIF